MTHLPTVVHGRTRRYDVPTLAVQRRRPHRPLCCECGWRGTAIQAVPYRDQLGVALACPTCGLDVLA